MDLPKKEVLYLLARHNDDRFRVTLGRAKREWSYSLHITIQEAADLVERERRNAAECAILGTGTEGTTYVLYHVDPNTGVMTDIPIPRVEVRYVVEPRTVSVVCDDTAKVKEGAVGVEPSAASEQVRVYDASYAQKLAAQFGDRCCECGVQLTDADTTAKLAVGPWDGQGIPPVGEPIGRLCPGCTALAPAHAKKGGECG
jgi:hypothetical protein